MSWRTQSDSLFILSEPGTPYDNLNAGDEEPRFGSGETVLEVLGETICIGDTAADFNPRSQFTPDC